MNAHVVERAKYLFALVFEGVSGSLCKRATKCAHVCARDSVVVGWWLGDNLEMGRWVGDELMYGGDRKRGEQQRCGERAEDPFEHA